MTAVPETEAALQAAAHAEKGFDPGTLIMHHIIDQQAVEIPFGPTYQLPTLHLPGLGWDISITRSVVMMWIASAVLLVVSLVVAWRSREPVPRGMASLLEIFILYVRDEVARKVIPRNADRYVGFLLTTFFFILSCNLLGLVPGMASATSAISVTATLAIISFLMTQSAGMRQYGVVGHFRNLVPHGLPVWLLPIMIVVEALGMFSRPFALCIRLFANMTAGHVIIISLISIIFIFESVWMALVSVPFVLFIDVLEILVALIQAFIFTMLTALFIGMAVHPAH